MRASNIPAVLSRRRGTAGFVAGACVATLVAGGGVAIAAIPSSSTATYAACVDRDSGDMRMIDRQKGERCRKKGEKAVSWSKGWTSGDIEGLTRMWDPEYPNLTFLATERDVAARTYEQVRQYYTDLLTFFVPSTWIVSDEAGAAQSPSMKRVDRSSDM